MRRAAQIRMSTRGSAVRETHSKAVVPREANFSIGYQAPPVGSSKRAISFMSVDLPAPVGPTTATVWPAGTVTSTSSMVTAGEPG